MFERLFRDITVFLPEAASVLHVIGQSHCHVFFHDTMLSLADMSAVQKVKTTCVRASVRESAMASQAKEKLFLRRFTRELFALGIDLKHQRSLAVQRLNSNS